MADNKIYLITAKKIPTEAVEIFTSKLSTKVGTPIKYTGAFGETYAHVAAVYETEEGSELHNWLKAAAGKYVSIFPNI